MVINIHLNINREVLDTKSFSDYVYSINSQIEDNFNSIYDTLVKKLDHKCVVQDVKTCDPHIKKFDLVSKIME